MQGEFRIKCNKVSKEATVCLTMKQTMKMYANRVDFAQNNLKSGQYSGVKKTLGIIEKDVRDNATALGCLGNKLEDIVDKYENAEITIKEETVKIKKSNMSFDNEDTSGKNETEMSYEEYLQYRANNAVDKNTKKLYEKYLEKVYIKDDEFSGTAHYNFIMNRIKYNEKDDEKNIRGVGCTYYHEVGHLIDDQSDLFGHTLVLECK